MTKVVPLKSYTKEFLSSTWSVDGGPSFLVRGPMMTSKTQTAAWLEFLKSIPDTSKRWMSLQLAMPDVEWPIITSEHFFLEGSWVPHLVIPTPLIYLPKKEDSRSDLQWKTILKFVQQINCEGWLYYSEWLDDDMDAVMSKFYKDAAHEFQVEATLEDFHHEITSFLLKDYRINCAKLVMQLGQGVLDGSQNRQRDFQLETEIVRMHFEILRNLATQRDVLIKIEQAIAKIEKMRPELIPLKLTVRLLSTLIGPPLSWVQTQLLLGLLNHQLKVGAYIHCDSGFDRTNLAFAVQLALKELLTMHSLDALVVFAEEYPLNSEIGVQFNRFVRAYLSEVCIPVTHSNPSWRTWMPDQERVNVFLEGKEQKAL